MLIHPQIDPVALQLGPLAIHWYGLMYLFAFAQFLLLGDCEFAKNPTKRCVGLLKMSRTFYFGVYWV